MYPETMYLFGKRRQEELMQEARAIHQAERFERTSLWTIFWWARAAWRPLILWLPQRTPRGEEL